MIANSKLASLSNATYVGLCETEHTRPIAPSDLVDCGNSNCNHRVWVSKEQFGDAMLCKEIYCTCCALNKMQRIENELPYT